MIPTDLTTQWKWSRWRSSERAANVTTLHSCHQSRCIARNVDPNAEVCGQNGYQTATVVFTSVTQKAYSRVEILPRSIGSQKVGVDVGAPGQRGNTVTAAAQPLPPNQGRTIDSPTLALKRTSLIFPPATKENVNSCHSVSRFEQFRFQKHIITGKDFQQLICVNRDHALGSSVQHLRYRIHRTAFPHAQNCARVMRIFSTSKPSGHCVTKRRPLYRSRTRAGCVPCRAITLHFLHPF